MLHWYYNSANYSALFTYSVVFRVSMAQIKRGHQKGKNGYMPKVMLLEENAFDRLELPWYWCGQLLHENYG